MRVWEAFHLVSEFPLDLIAERLQSRLHLPDRRIAPEALRPNPHPLVYDCLRQSPLEYSNRSRSARPAYLGILLSEEHCQAGTNESMQSFP